MNKKNNNYAQSRSQYFHKNANSDFKINFKEDRD